MDPRIALVTSQDLPTIDVDDELLASHLPGAEILAWEDESVTWSEFDLVILRSTWNYTEHLEDFLGWAARVASQTRLVNPLSVIKWNTDKKYLASLEQAGIPVVPTTYVAPGEETPEHVLAGQVVIKPTVGAGSRGAGLIRDDIDAAAAHVRMLHDQGNVAMIQPYLSHVDTRGETALVYVGGRFSHAARKAAILSRDLEWSTGLYADEKIVPATATASEREIGDRLVASLPELVPGGEGVAYARVDLLPTDDGPVVLELELTEPSLFLLVDSGAAARAAAAFLSLATGGDYDARLGGK
jgi:glutathione synthase/RimK-type ligase-like ATP-grasp enzyme